MSDPTVLTCLTGYIRVSDKVCTQPTPTPDPDAADAVVPSDLYLTHLPGITLDSMESLSDGEMKNFNEVYAVIEKRALLKFRSAVLLQLNKCYSICDMSTLDCIVCGNLSLLATSLWYMLGIEFCNETLYSNTINRYTTIDKKNALKMRDDFSVDFEVELINAMKGIDISDCVDEPTESGGSVSYQESSIC